MSGSETAKTRTGDEAARSERCPRGTRRPFQELPPRPGVIDKLGTAGIAGALLLLAGLALIASADLIVAVGIALVLAGTGLVVKGLATSLMRQFGFA